MVKIRERIKRGLRQRVIRPGSKEAKKIIARGTEKKRKRKAKETLKSKLEAGEKVTIAEARKLGLSTSEIAEVTTPIVRTKQRVDVEKKLARGERVTTSEARRVGFTPKQISQLSKLRTGERLTTSEAQKAGLSFQETADLGRIQLRKIILEKEEQRRKELEQAKQRREMERKADIKRAIKNLPITMQLKQIEARKDLTVLEKEDLKREVLGATPGLSAKEKKRLEELVQQPVIKGVSISPGGTIDKKTARAAAKKGGNVFNKILEFKLSNNVFTELADAVKTTIEGQKALRKLQLKAKRDDKAAKSVLLGLANIAPSLVVSIISPIESVIDAVKNPVEAYKAIVNLSLADIKRGAEGFRDRIQTGDSKLYTDLFIGYKLTPSLKPENMFKEIRAPRVPQSVKNVIKKADETLFSKDEVLTTKKLIQNLEKRASLTRDETNLLKNLRAQLEIDESLRFITSADTDLIRSYKNILENPKTFKTNTQKIKTITRKIDDKAKTISTNKKKIKGPKLTDKKKSELLAKFTKEQTPELAIKGSQIKKNLNNLLEDVNSILKKAEKGEIVLKDKDLKFLQTKRRLIFNTFKKIEKIIQDKTTLPTKENLFSFVLKEFEVAPGKKVNIVSDTLLEKKLKELSKKKPEKKTLTKTELKKKLIGSHTEFLNKELEKVFKQLENLNIKKDVPIKELKGPLLKFAPEKTKDLIILRDKILNEITSFKKIKDISLKNLETKVKSSREKIKPIKIKKTKKKEIVNLDNKIKIINEDIIKLIKSKSTGPRILKQRKTIKELIKDIDDEIRTVKSRSGEQVIRKKERLELLKDLNIRKSRLNEALNRINSNINKLISKDLEVLNKNIKTFKEEIIQGKKISKLTKEDINKILSNKKSSEFIVNKIKDIEKQIDKNRNLIKQVQDTFKFLDIPKKEKIKIFNRLGEIVNENNSLLRFKDKLLKELKEASKTSKNAEFEFKVERGKLFVKRKLTPTEVQTARRAQKFKEEISKQKPIKIISKDITNNVKTKIVKFGKLELEIELRNFEIGKRASVGRQGQILKPQIKIRVTPNSKKEFGVAIDKFKENVNKAIRRDPNFKRLNQNDKNIKKLEQRTRILDKRKQKFDDKTRKKFKQAKENIKELRRTHDRALERLLLRALLLATDVKKIQKDLQANQVADLFKKVAKEINEQEQILREIVQVTQSIKPIKPKSPKPPITPPKRPPKKPPKSPKPPKAPLPPKLPPKRPPTKPPKKPKFPFFPTFDTPLKKGERLSFDIVFREKGKVKNLGVKLPLNKALAKATRLIDNTTARSMELRIVGITKAKDTKVPKTLNKFDKRKTLRALKLVEKSKFAIDRPGEVRGLRVGKAIKKAKKKITNKKPLKKKKTVKRKSKKK